jgi:N4-(beta-N-acetylglucosaminyl)-L-asparaginase
MKRRNFLFKASLASVLAANSCKVDDDEKNNSTNKSEEGSSNYVFSFPLVISTWNNKQANATTLTLLQNGMTCLDAMVEGIKIPEGNPLEQSVGYGGRPDRDGNVTLDACIMDHRGNAGSVAYVKNYPHPIEIAKLVMQKTPHVMLVGDGAESFAKEMKLQPKELLTEKSKNEYENWKKTSLYKPIINIERHDTIGMLCIDKNGDITGGCSTSGMAYKMAGRVGDSPIIGAGLYVDNEVGACTATGHGEYLLRFPGAILAVEYMKNGDSPQVACQKVIERLVSKNKDKVEEYQIGLIAVNKKGEVGYYSARCGFTVTIHNDQNQIYTESKFEIKE